MKGKVDGKAGESGIGIQNVKILVGFWIWMVDFWLLGCGCGTSIGMMESGSGISSSLMGFNGGFFSGCENSGTVSLVSDEVLNGLIATLEKRKAEKRP